MTTGRRTDPADRADRAAPRALRRGRDAVQLGWSAGTGGVVVSGLDPTEMAVITGLEGGLASLGGLAGTIDAAALQRAAARIGITRSRTRRLIAVLRDHGLLRQRPADPPAPARLPGEHVVVEGTGPLAWQVATLLRAGGVGRVDLGPEAADDLEQQLRAGAPGTTAPALVVLVGRPVVAPHRGEPWRGRGVPVLPVVVEGRRVLAGPLVRDDGGPCLHCLDHVRTDLDSAWPVIATQASDGLPPDDETLLTLAAAVVTLLVRAHLDGPGVPPGVSVEAALPWPRLDHRRWPRHPGCDRHDASPPLAPTAPRTRRRAGAGETATTRGETMSR